MKKVLQLFVLIAVLAGTCWGGEVSENTDLWQLARQKSNIHRFSTLFTAQNVRDHLGSDENIDRAIAWCKATGVTKVYLESYRDRYQAEKATLVRARDRFRKEGFIVPGCVTTTRIGKISTGWNSISCYTNEGTQDQLEQIFRYVAGIFDVVMIDDFWFTDCECDECKSAKGDRTWSEYRLALMDRMSRERVIGPARDVNRKVKVIIKYPEWYDLFHERGYDVVRETELFDVTWIGTETRDPDSERWGKKPQFGAYWLAQWAKAFSHGKLGGGWYDPYGTHEDTYVEQGRQTILGQCRECMLFCYGSLQQQTGPDNVAKLRRELPGHFDLAEFVQGETPRGVGTYKVPNSSPGDDWYVFNFIGMLGIPMTADLAFPSKAPSLFLSQHAIADPDLVESLTGAIDAKTPLLLTSCLRDALPEAVRKQLDKPSIKVLELDAARQKRSAYRVLDSVRDLMNLSREEVDALRRPLIAPLGVELSAPPRVSLYLYGKNKVVLENFNDEAVNVTLKVRDAKRVERALVLPPEASGKLKPEPSGAEISLPPRSLVALRTY